MRVLYIASGDYKYGASKSMMSLVLYMKKHYDVEPVLLTKKRNKLNEICDENGIENYSCWYSDFMSGSPYTFVPLKLAKHTVKYLLYILGCFKKSSVLKCGLDLESIDIIHTNLNRLEIGAYIKSKKNIPHVWHLREFGKEDYNVVFYKPGTINFMNRYTDKFIAISEAVADCWVKKGIDKDKTVTIYNGLENDVYIEKQKRNDNKLKLVISGHIQPGKGQLQIVQAIALLPEEIRKNVELDILGEGYKDYINKINKVIKDNSLDNINFFGYCDNVPKKLSEYDVGVMCSKAEGFGRVTVEYMLAGLCVIASDTGANPELVKTTNRGILYKYNDIKSLSDCIRKIYENKEQYCNNSLPKDIFTVKEYADKVYEVYKSVIRQER